MNEKNKFVIGDRRSLRMKGIEYNFSGMYFVTICTEGKKCLFGSPLKNQMVLNESGKIVEEEWLKTAEVRPYVILDCYVVMPNHFHAVLFLDNLKKTDDSGATHRVAPTTPPKGPKPGSLGAIIGQFKSITTKRINRIWHEQSIKIWQRNYYEHVIRDEKDLDGIRQYIFYNPAKWEEDEYYSSQNNKSTRLQNPR